ncbi:hypothetical protein SAMN05216548_1325 [Faunimonas pinastri]|uniref:Uncharacterized protein n=1 Tax=Faunimonas pinastri TaxID=1855383 RepID=A0A1H9QPS3_9HYPH|nr:hypothetical protein SAMN05216548_1325 [Faunimonas pinastri]
MPNPRLLPILLLTTSFLPGCVSTSSEPATSVPDLKPACGQVRDWSVDFQTELAQELDKLPRTDPLWQIFRDAVAARTAVRTCRGDQSG